MEHIPITEDITSGVLVEHLTEDERVEDDGAMSVVNLVACQALTLKTVIMLEIVVKAVIRSGRTSAFESWT